MFSRLGHVYTKFYISKLLFVIFCEVDHFYSIDKYITNQEIDDEKQEGLLIFIQTLSHLTTKDYVNLKSAGTPYLIESVFY